MIHIFEIWGINSIYSPKKRSFLAVLKVASVINTIQTLFRQSVQQKALCPYQLFVIPNTDGVGPTHCGRFPMGDRPHCTKK